MAQCAAALLGDGRRRGSDSERMDTVDQGGSGAREAAVGGTGEAAVGGAGTRRGARGCGVRAVGTRRYPDSALTRSVSAARDGHTAAARCRVGPARRAKANKRGPLVSDFRIKNLPQRKLTQIK
jgi:hypothetical protein